MYITYQLDENDFLMYQLFVASRSRRIITKRQRSRLIFAVAYIAAGLYFYLRTQMVLAFTFTGFGMLWYVMYPLWTRWIYKQHYRNYIRENYQGRVGKTGRLEIHNDLIIARDEASESKIQITEVEAIFEIPSFIFIKIKNGHYFILPQNKIQPFDELRNTLLEIAAQLHIPYSKDADWQWK